METVVAEAIITYSCNCPECDETIYSDYDDNWDIYEMIHTDQKLTCNECGCEFYVTI